MLQKYIPNKILSATSYAEICDHVIMRPEAHRLQLNHINNFSQITDNSKVFCWTSMLNDLIANISDKNNITLFLGDEDHTININGDKNFHIIPNNVKLCFAQNSFIQNNVMKALPIGLCPYWGHGISSLEQLKSVIVPIEHNKLLYVNFNKQTNKTQRTDVYNILMSTFSNCSYVTFINNFFKNNMLHIHYEYIQSHKFVACPPGNGLDTHRLWESLYMGSIPIVEDNHLNRYFAKYFPILLVERWTDLNEEYLNKKYEEISSKEWKYNLLDRDNWMTYHGL
jgi:hypothetical protein